ncbi:transmembrane protein, putative [Medicago truncatula]|uniref:Transmembrane protein, putative n=1 Tax=Medicago truncatula TaxID=3880 RepID=G7I461_MEDTR|nr:transmembrane protein, putative [Medicago truncatula]
MVIAEPTGNHTLNPFGYYSMFRKIISLVSNTKVPFGLTFFFSFSTFLRRNIVQICIHVTQNKRH